MDALRADHLGCYGYYRDTSPNLDKLTKDAATFKNVVAQSSWTLPSFSSLFTATYPSVHKCDNEKNKLGIFNITIAQILKTQGYRTCAFVESPYLGKEFGLDKGFDNLYLEPYKKTEQAVNKLLDWIKKNRTHKLFILLHTYVTHTPYTPKKPYNKLYDPLYSGNVDPEVEHYASWDTKENGYFEDAELTPIDKHHIIALYDGAIRYVDDIIGSLIVSLKKNHLYKNSLIIITSDHGDSFYEHKMWSHARHIYDEVLRIPLFIKFPRSRFKGREVQSQVRSIDIVPTILDVLKLPKKQITQGKSLLPLLTPEDGRNAQDRIAYSETRRGGKLQRKIVSLRTIRYKYIYHFFPDGVHFIPSKEELYDLKNDPKETRDLIKQERRLGLYMRAKVVNYLKNCEKISSPAVKTNISQETYEKLRALGYLH